MTNTPWKERHSYVIEREPDETGLKNITNQQEKALHVSPFFQMDHNYRFLFSEPKERLLVEIKNLKDSKIIHESILKLRKHAFNQNQLLKIVTQFPFITLRVVSAIHWQAVKLWLKGATFYSNPGKPKTN